MRSVYNAATDTITELGLGTQMDDFVTHDDQSPGRWIVRFMSKPGSLTLFLIEVEVLDEGNEEPTISVLHRLGIGRYSMERILDRFQERLTRPRVRQPSPPSRREGDAPARG